MTRYERKVAILGGSTALLLAAWLAGYVFSPERRSERAESRALFAGKTESAAYIELGGPALTLVKEGADWFLQDGPARLPVQASRVDGFLEALSSVKRLRPIAKGKGAWKELGLEEDKAKRVLVKGSGGSILADFCIGGYDPSGQGRYLRLSGADESFSAEGSFASYAQSGRQSWLDLRVIPGPLPETDVEAVSIKAAIALDGAGKPALSASYALKRVNDGWSGIPGSIDPVAISALLRSILNLEGEDIVASPPASAFSPVSARIELSLGNGGSRVLEVGAAAGEGRFHLRLAGGERVYTVSAYGLRNALRPAAALLAKK